MTNYKTLLDQLEHRRGEDEQVALVTFNYDRLLEDALLAVGIAISDIADYAGDRRYFVTKLHGSVDWGREVLTPVASLASGHAWTIAAELIERAADLQFSARYRKLVEYPAGIV